MSGTASVTKSVEFVAAVFVAVVDKVSSVSVDTSVAVFGGASAAASEVFFATVSVEVSTKIGTGTDRSCLRKTTITVVLSPLPSSLAALTRVSATSGNKKVNVVALSNANL